MWFKKKELPDSNDLVLCTVKKILPHGVFVNLDEYENLEGLINISEIAPGRIRNIREYVAIDKKIVCKVLRVNKVNRHIDLSLRRVSFNTKNRKLQDYKQEEKAEKLLEFAGKQIKFKLEDMYKEAGLKIIEEFGSLQNGFENIATSKEDLLKKMNVKEKVLDILTKTIKEKIKPSEIRIRLILELKSYEPNGMELIKKALSNVYDAYNKKGINLSILYISAPRYKLEIKTTDKKNSNKIAENIAEEIIKEGKKLNIIGKWQEES
jgi:translation initiation factor 2 subunit 1